MRRRDTMYGVSRTEEPEDSSQEVVFDNDKSAIFVSAIFFSVNFHSHEVIKRREINKQTR